MKNWKLHRVSLTDEEWGHLLEKTPHTLFHEPIWAHVIEEGFGGETCCLVLERDGEIEGGILGFFQRILWAKFLFFSYPYGGAIGQIPTHDGLARLLTEFARKERISRVRVADSPLLPSTPSDGFSRIKQETHMLCINERTYDEIWATFKSSIRRNVRKAIRNGVTMEETMGQPGIDEFFSLYLESMRRNRAVPKYSRKLVAAILDRIVKTGKGALLLARREGQAIAGILVVDSEQASHYLMGGSRTDALKYRSNDLLFSEAIKRAVDKGFAFFDFLPSGIEDHSLVQFKTKWGAAPFPADTLDLVIRPLSMGLWNLAYRAAGTSLARRVLQRYQGRKESSL
jgi:hypothetical protein